MTLPRKPPPEHALVLDLETTDTDPYAGHATVLEIGAIVVRHTPELEVLGEASLLVRPPGLASDHDWIWSEMHPVVREMHSANGLWSEATTSEDAWALHDADAAVVNWIRELTGSDAQLPLLGSGVGHMDQPWVKACLPRLAAATTYWTLDVGVLRRTLELAGRDDLVDMVTDVDAKPHRGLDDARLHLTEMRRYVGLLGAIPRADVGVVPTGQPAEDGPTAGTGAPQPHEQGKVAPEASAARTEA